MLLKWQMISWNLLKNFSHFNNNFIQEGTKKKLWESSSREFIIRHRGSSSNVLIDFRYLEKLFNPIKASHQVIAKASLTLEWIENSIKSFELLESWVFKEMRKVGKNYKQKETLLIFMFKQLLRLLNIEEQSK